MCGWPINTRKDNMPNPSIIIAPSGTIVVDPTAKTISIHDGYTPGGITVPTLSTGTSFNSTTIINTSTVNTVTVVDSLLSTGTTVALSAAQGKFLKDAVDALAAVVSAKGGPIVTQDEGTTLSTNTVQLNFVGAGVTVSNVGQTVTVSIPGGSLVQAPTLMGATYTLSAADDDKSFYTTGSVSVTVPAGLTPRPSIFIDCPTNGTVSVSVSGNTTINASTATITRTRANNPAGVVIVAHQDADGYGVSGS